jgi:hypothetical protein
VFNIGTKCVTGYLQQTADQVALNLSALEREQKSQPSAASGLGTITQEKLSKLERQATRAL